MRNDWPADEDLNVLVFEKGPERYVFIWIDSERRDMLRRMGLYAANPDLSFSWWDAARLTWRSRQMQEAD